MTSKASAGSLQSWIGNLSFWLAAAILWLAPFEMLTPILSLPGQRISNLELVIGLGLLGGLAQAAFSRGGRPWRTSLTLPLVLLLLVMLVSSGLSTHTRHALLFTGRFGIAVLILHLIANRIDSRRRLRILLTGLTLAGSLVAILGVLEYLQVPPVVSLLRAFQAGTNYAGTQIRVASTLQYPTITSMYLEMVFALAMGLLLDHLEHRRRAGTAILLAVQLLLAGCLFLTLTRSGILSLALILLMSCGYALRNWGMDTRTATLGLLGLTLVLELAGTSLASQEARLRLVTANPRDWYQVRYQVPAEMELGSDDLHSVEIGLENTGRATWESEGETSTRLSYHWFLEDGSMVVDYEGMRTHLPHPVLPGESIRLRATVRAPRRPGTYRLAWDLVQEDRFWFSRETAPSAWTTVKVSGEPSATSPASLQKPPLPRLLLSRPRLWSLAFGMWREDPWLGVGPDCFRLLYGSFAGLEISDLTYHTHNLFLEFFVNTGLIGGMLFLWTVFRLLRMLARTRLDPADLPLQTAVAAAVAVILVHGLLDYYLEFTTTYAMIFGIFGLVEALNRGFRKPAGDRVPGDCSATTR